MILIMHEKLCYKMNPVGANDSPRRKVDLLENIVNRTWSCSALAFAHKEFSGSKVFGVASDSLETYTHIYTIN
jgi:hypothetical protein